MMPRATGSGGKGGASAGNGGADGPVEVLKEVEPMNVCDSSLDFARGERREPRLRLRTTHLQGRTKRRARGYGSASGSRPAAHAACVRIHHSGVATPGCSDRNSSRTAGSGKRNVGNSSGKMSRGPTLKFLSLNFGWAAVETVSHGQTMNSGNRRARQHQALRGPRGRAPACRVR